MNTANKLIEEAQELDRDAQALAEAAKQLRVAAGILGCEDPKPFDGTRAEQLAQFIQRRGGSATRTEIVRDSGIPAGTVASLLGSKKKFEKDSTEKWHIKNRELAIQAQSAQA